jgi:hypothetical protein
MRSKYVKKGLIVFHCYIEKKLNKNNHLTKSAYQLVLGFERVSRIFWAFGSDTSFFKA